MHNAVAKQTRTEVVHVIQGDFATSADPETVLTTVLGSCVATCLYDPTAQIGGLNHFLLPGNEYKDANAVMYGVNAMELLINALLKKGAVKRRLQAKLFGGARMIEGLSDIGEKNAQFAIEFLAQENILCVGKSLGGMSARRIRFWPSTGQARQRLIGDAAIVPVVVPAPAVVKADNDLELF